MLRKVLICLLSALLVVTIFAPSVKALTGAEASFPKITEYDVAEQYNISICAVCSGHTSFDYATFNEDGWFAISCFTSEKKVEGTDPAGTVYIDVFNEEGVFQKEIVMDGRGGCSIRLNGQTLYLYTYNDLILYDMETGELSGYRTPDNYVKDKELNVTLTKISFEKDGWQYKCGPSMLRYTSITRTNGDQTETLLQLSGKVPGTNQPLWEFFLIPLAVLLPAGVLGIVLWKKLCTKGNQKG